jgi:hypothetical protein
VAGKRARAPEPVSKPTETRIMREKPTGRVFISLDNKAQIKLLKRTITIFWNIKEDPEERG